MSRANKTKKSIAIKICGLTDISQAEDIAALDPEAIGVVGVKSSPRFANEHSRRGIFSTLKLIKPDLKRVWVIADFNDLEVKEGLEGEGRPSVIQLHGNESPERCKEFKTRYPDLVWWKAIRLREETDLEIANQYSEIVDALLLDAWDKKKMGGTGESIPLNWLKKASFKSPWWLAGGISSETITETLRVLKPYGVDASSRLEIKPGIKDINKVSILIKKVREAN